MQHAQIQDLKLNKKEKLMYIRMTLKLIKKNAKENDSNDEDITNNTYVMRALFDEPGSTVPATDTGFERSGGVTGACAVTQNGTSQGFEKKLRVKGMTLALFARLQSINVVENKKLS